MNSAASTAQLPFSVSVVVPVYNSEATLIELRQDAAYLP